MCALVCGAFVGTAKEVHRRETGSKFGRVCGGLGPKTSTPPPPQSPPHSTSGLHVLVIVTRLYHTALAFPVYARR